MTGDCAAADSILLFRATVGELVCDLGGDLSPAGETDRLRGGGNRFGAVEGLSWIPSWATSDTIKETGFGADSDAFEGIDRTNSAGIVSSIAITTPRDSPEVLGILNISNSVSFGGLVE